jgi:hypothetical protein
MRRITIRQHFQGQTRGWGLWHRQWLSICSQHRRAVRTCPRCMTGRYCWTLGPWFSLGCYALVPQVWRWWMHRRH